MIDELNQAIAAYQQKWEKMIAKRKNRAFFKRLQPTAVGWKTTDLADFDKCFAGLRNHCDQIHIGWVNDRWLATLHLKDNDLTWGITVVKLMQRRPNSTDAVGVDHVDFYSPEVVQADIVLRDETGLKWTEETNGKFCAWKSIWFENAEAKLRTNTVIDVCVAELEDVKKRVMNKER